MCTTIIGVREKMGTELVTTQVVIEDTLTQEVVEIALSDGSELDLFSGTDKVWALLFI